MTPDGDCNRALVCVCGGGRGPPKFGTEMLGPFLLKLFLVYLRVLFEVQEIPKLKGIPTKILFSLHYLFSPNFSSVSARY